MSDPLAESYRVCQSLARRTGQNFYWSFLTLPRALRRDMSVLYAFMRHTDDLGDNPDLSLDCRREQLQIWREEVQQALEGKQTDPPAREILPAVADMVRRHDIPVHLLMEVINGVESDLTPRSIDTFPDLESYCYQVAGAVGLCCICTWGCHHPKAQKPAIACGTAFQLTNILRDLKEDAQQARLYLPREDLERFGVTFEDLKQGRYSKNFEQMMRFQIDRARTFYRSALPLFDCLDRPGRRILTAMYRIYGGLLRRIETSRYDVFSRRISLSRSHKISLAIRSYLNPM